MGRISAIPDPGDGDRVVGVLGEGGQVARVAGEHHWVGGGAGVGDDGVRSGDRGGVAGSGAQACCFTGAYSGDVADLAGAQQPVGVEVAPVDPGERLGHDDCGDVATP